MQKQRRSNNWMAILLFILITGLTIWLISYLLKNKNPEYTSGNFQAKKSSVYSSLEKSQLEFESLSAERDCSNPPYAYMQNGIGMGLGNDLIQNVANEFDLILEFKLSSLVELEENLRMGMIEIIERVTSLDQQNLGFLFGIPHIVQYNDFFVHKNGGYQSLSNLYDKTMMDQNGDSVEEQLAFEGIHADHLVYVKNPPEAFVWHPYKKYKSALLTPNQDDYLNKIHHLNHKGGGNTLQTNNYRFALSQKYRALLLKNNQPLAIIGKNGTFDELIKKWVSIFQQASIKDRKEFYIYGLVILFSAVLVVFLWGWSLRRLVRRKTDESNSHEERFRQLMNNSSEGVAIIANREVVYFNPQSASIVGLSEKKPDEPIDVLEFIHPLDQDLVLEKYEQLLQGPPVNIQVSIRLLKSTGVTIWIKVNSIKINWGGVLALLVFFTDITEEKRLQEAIKTSEEKYRLIFTQFPVGLFYFDPDLRITNVNDHFAEIMCTKPDELQGFDLKNIKETSLLDALNRIVSHENGLFEGWIDSFKDRNRKRLYIKLRTAPLINELSEFQGGVGLLEDLSEKIRTEDKIQNLEDRFAKTFLTSTDAISIANLKTGIFIDVNQGFVDLSGFSKDECIGKTARELNIWVDLKDQDRLLECISKSGGGKNLEVVLRNKDGQTHFALMSSSVIEIEGDRCILSITRIVDEIKKNEQLIRDSEMRYRSIFESVPVSIWEQDLVEVYDMLTNLRDSGVEDLYGYMDEHPEFVEAAVQSIKIIDVNEASLKIYKASSKKELNVSLDKIFNEESLANFKKELQAIWNRETFFSGDSVNLDLQGNRIFIDLVMRIPKERSEFSNVLVSITDITQRKLAEEALLESESRYRQLVEQVNVVVYLDYACLPSRPKYISPQIESLLGYSQEEWMADPNLMMKVIHPDDLQSVLDADSETDKTGEPFIIEYRAFSKDGRLVWIHDEAVLACDNEGKPDDWHGVMYDVTARKMAEEALKESEYRYRMIFNSVPLSIKQEDFTDLIKMFEELRHSGVSNLENYIQSHPEWIKVAAAKVRVTEVNQETLLMYKAESKEQLLQSLDKFFTEESYNCFQKELLAFWNHQTTFVQETVNKTLTGEKIDVWVSLSLPPDQVDYSKVLVTILDITERKRNEEQIRIQVRYLAALHAVDMAISASMDLPITLRVLINQVQQQLLVDAVSILILDLHTQTLKYSAGIGFKTNAIESTNLRLGQSYAGQAALERHIVTAEDLNLKTSLFQTRDFDKEDFTHYIGIPLISKGTVKGVLELFNHNAFTQESSWMVLLESLAGQAAIAIENATLMDEVQKINMNLRSAYDATIEGWARSLDIRSGDSENHSKRVADLAVELAHAAGFHGEGLLTLRHGALLHDIGKLAVPESILLKPGPLTNEEWPIMKSHPTVAKQLLNSIEFLQSAIEIPYYHHERWDGTGYPEGLKGLEIPFPARIFAIVDCWDSLRINRPWRKAWTDGNALDYIESNAGKAFDPQIVDKFKQLIGHGFSTYF